MTPKTRKTDSEGDRGYMQREIEIGEHDEICDRRLGWMKTAIFVIFSFLIGGGLIGFVSGQDMKSTNTLQDQKIDENTKDIAEVKGSLNEHMREQKSVNKEMLEILNAMRTDIVVIKRGVQ